MTTEERLADLLLHCQTAAEFYAKSPGLAGAATIIDIYQTVALLIHLLGPERERLGTESGTPGSGLDSVL